MYTWVESGLPRCLLFAEGYAHLHCTTLQSTFTECLHKHCSTPECKEDSRHVSLKSAKAFVSSWINRSSIYGGYFSLSDRVQGIKVWEKYYLRNIISPKIWVLLLAFDGHNVLSAFSLVLHSQTQSSTYFRMTLSYRLRLKTEQGFLFSKLVVQYKIKN